MSTALRPNGINDALVGNDPADPVEVVAAGNQPIPDQRQTATVIEYWLSATAQIDGDDLDLDYECWTAATDGAGGYTLGTQVGPTLNLVVASAAAMEAPITGHCKLMWLDQSPQQAGTYVVTGLLNAGGIEVYIGQSVALTSIGP